MLLGIPFKTFQIGKEEPHLDRAVCRPRKLSKACWALKGTPTCTAAQLGRWRSPAAIPPGFFSQLSHMSYMPELGNCFLKYSFCNFKNNRKKEKQWGRDTHRTISPSARTPIQALKADFRWHDLVSSGSCALPLPPSHYEEHFHHHHPSRQTAFESSWAIYNFPKWCMTLELSGLLEHNIQQAPS